MSKINQDNRKRISLNLEALDLATRTSKKESQNDFDYENDGRKLYEEIKIGKMNDDGQFTPHEIREVNKFNPYI